MTAPNREKTPTSPSQPHRVICYGDSLTEGYTFNSEGQLDFKPYAAELNRISDGKYIGIQYGVSGELTGKIWWRIQCGLENPATRPAYEAQGQQEGELKGGPTILPGDHVVILAGSNDLGNDYGAEEIFANIKGMVTDILTSVSEPGPRTLILCTIPPLSKRNEMSGYCKKLRENRAAVNRMIVEYIHSLQPSTPQIRTESENDNLLSSVAPGNTQFKVLDLFSRMSEVPAMFSEEELQESREIGAGPGESWPPSVMKEKWAADHIHFNEDGYEQIAADVVAALNGEAFAGPCRIPPALSHEEEKEGKEVK